MPWTAFRPNLGRKAASSPAAIPNVSPTPGQEASVADGPVTSSRSFTARQRRRFVLRQPSVPEVKGGAAAPSPTAARHGQRRLALVPTNGQMQHHAARMKLSSAANDVVEACATASLEELKGKIDALTAAYDHAANGLSMEQREPQDMAAVITAALADYSPRASSSAPTNTQSLEDTPTPTDTSSSDQSSIEIAQAEHNACASSASPKSSKWKGLKLAASLAAKGGSNTPAPDTSANADANKWKNSLRSLASGKNLGSFVGIRRHSLISPRSSLAEPLLAAHYNPETSPVTAFLIDLDGTMYDPAGLLPGAASFYRWLVESGTPHVFLSNTGAKNATAVQKKFSTPPYVLSSTREHVPLKNIMTAGEAQVDYMLDVIPPGAKILVISGGDGAWRRDLDNRGGDAGKELAASWEIRTHLGDAEAKAWATISARSRGISSSKPVWVVFFTDGDIRGQQDAVTGDSGFGDWGFEVIKISSFLLNHGAQFVYTADDAFNPCVDPEYPGLVFPLVRRRATNARMSQRRQLRK